MTLEKAIEIGEGVVNSNYFTPNWDVSNALKLLIEAGKVYQKSQEAGWYPPGYKLPGETKD